MREKKMYYFVYLENIHWRRWIFYVKLFCAHTTIHIFTSLHILLRAVSFLSDSYKSARVIIYSGQDSHDSIHNKMILSHDSSFSHCQSFIYIQHVCLFNVTKCDTIFLSLQLCWMYMWKIQMWCILPLNICSCIVFHTTPTDSRVVLSSNRRWKVCTKINWQKPRIQKFAYDNNFILHYSEHNCVHSFYSYSFVYLWCCENSLHFSRLRLSFYMYRACV